MSYSVYKIVNTVNPKLYIGCTNNITNRWQVHLSDAKRNTRPLYCDMREYGIQCFSIEQIEEWHTELKARRREVYWMRILNTAHPYGYNLQVTKVTEAEAYIIQHDIWKWPSERYASFFGIHKSRIHQIRTYGL